jgi:hypothetical protein
MTRKQRKQHNMLMRKNAERVSNRIPQDLSGPERWALVDKINKTQNLKQQHTSWQQLVASDTEVSYINAQGIKTTKYTGKNPISRTDYKKIKSI